MTANTWTNNLFPRRINGIRIRTKIKNTMKPPYITLLIAKSTGGIFHQAIMIYRTLRTKKLIPANRYFFEIRLNQFCRLRKVFNHILILPSFSKFFLVKKDTILREDNSTLKWFRFARQQHLVNFFCDVLTILVWSISWTEPNNTDFNRCFFVFIRTIKLN